MAMTFHLLDGRPTVLVELFKDFHPVKDIGDGRWGLRGGGGDSGGVGVVMVYSDVGELGEAGDWHGDYEEM